VDQFLRKKENFTDPTFTQRSKISGILRTRAWVYQERMLALRSLHLLEQELMLGKAKKTKTHKSPNHSDNVRKMAQPRKQKAPGSYIAV
jgi:hypothetical protein